MRRVIGELPVNLVLEMWEFGCMANTIAHALGLTGHRPVEKIVAFARSTGDMRAVLHTYEDGRDVGRRARAQQVIDRHPDIDKVAIVKNVSICTRGHRQNRRNTYRLSDGRKQCKICAKLRVREGRLAKRVRESIDAVTPL